MMCTNTYDYDIEIILLRTPRSSTKREKKVAPKPPPCSSHYTPLRNRRTGTRYRSPEKLTPSRRA